MKAGKCLVLGLILLLWAEPIRSNALYPIEPRPLRKLIIESPFIVIGFVEVIEKEKGEGREYSVARIRVDEVLQGDISESEIKVRYNPYYICPAPPYYEANTNVIVFLDKNKSIYSTHALSYGSKTLSLQEIALYKARIVEMQHILKIDDLLEQFEQTVEWLVKCAEYPATRWEGTFELSPSSDFMSYYVRDEKKDYSSLLTRAQRERLKTALFTNSDRPCDFGLVDLVYRNNEEPVEKFLLDQLKTIDDRYQWTASEFMVRLMHRDPSGAAHKIQKEFAETLFDQHKQDDLKRLLSEFIALVDK